MLTLSVDVDGVRRKMMLLGAATRDLTEPLARIGGYLRSKSEKKFDAQGPGWPQLAPSTEARKIDAAEIELLTKSKSGKSVARTMLREARKLARAEAAYDKATTDKQRDKAAFKGYSALSTLNAARRAFSGNRQFTSAADLVAFAQREERRQRLHGYAQRASRRIADTAERRKVGRIGQRRYKAEEGADRMLGNLSKSISIKLNKGGVEVYSKALIGAIHNEGGTAGHGAKIPARPFLKLDSADIQVAVKILQEYFENVLVD